MLFVFLADALVSVPPHLELNLVCEGQYEDVETSVGTTSGVVGGELRSGRAVVDTRIMRAGTAHITLEGASGQLTYPDGRQRALGNVIADARQITAEYQRKQLIRTITWRIEINRMTGAMRVVSGNDIGFAGTCAPESTQPKF
jgi:hypothetical protein